MKKIISSNLSALALLACLMACGKDNNNNGNINNQQTANQIAAQCQGNQQCIEMQMQRLYGRSSQGYYQGTQNHNGQAWQQYQVPYYQSNRYAPPMQQNFWTNGNQAYYGRQY